jgi:hypothetical protein
MEGFIKDKSTGAIINTDNSYYNQVLLMRKKRKDAESLNSRVSNLENDISEIKSLLLQLIERK